MQNRQFQLAILFFEIFPLTLFVRSVSSQLKKESLSLDKKIENSLKFNTTSTAGGH